MHRVTTRQPFWESTHNGCRGRQMFFIPAYPVWSLTIIAVDVVALYALCMYGSRENLGG